MKAGNKGFQWSMMVLVMILVLGTGFSVQAQTTESTCANDSLFLLSPDAIVFEKQIQGRNGLVIKWKDLDLEGATCFALVGHEDLDYPVNVDGGFGDKVDRQFAFSISDSGVVGSTDPNLLLLEWVSQGPNPDFLAGTINLSNNGGIFGYSESAGSWHQENEALPKYWRQTNTTAIASGSGGFLVAAFSSGQTIDSKPKGLFVRGQLGWQILAEDVFTSSVLITALSVSPENNDHFAVGTESDGLFVTTDGGQNFVLWGSNLDEDFEPAPSTVRISALEWSSTRIWAFVPSFGLFYSEDDGATFHRSILEVAVNLDDPEAGVALPVNIFDITVDPSDESHVLVSLQFNGIFQSYDGGQTWNDTYGDLLVPNPENEGAWVYTAINVLVDPDDGNILLAGMKNRGLYRTINGGLNWLKVGEGEIPENLSLLNRFSFLAGDGPAGLFYCLMDEWSVLVSPDRGVTWNHLAEQPLILRGLSLVPAGDGTGDFYMGSWGGGLFVPGSTLSLSGTYNSGTSFNMRDLDLGLDITIGSGTLLPGLQFTLKCQTFQGWAVWRGSGYDPEEMALIGIFDRVNPESCIEGYCGNMNWQIIPQCYNSKRAACFNFDTPDSVSFFDEEIYNGFSYNYAISSFDYGNTAMTTAQNSTAPAIYSPRWSGDGLSPFVGGGNRKFIQMDEQPTPDISDVEIYVYPNPLRLDSGLPGEEGIRVVFTNLPEGARVRVFTTAGDDVINLGPDNLNGGNIYWRTRNRHGEDVSPGVYLYKVEMPHRADFWGKLVIIR